ncbi:hypothetical protein [uncultured Bacteroides sp.]|uniref:hypothetical protein n=1 Tax=uncultured Bacteroides sp. TaxID=162156 RepID=UPI002AABD9A1|nr:hypothetical protein [uncultured Bacteroides sp.]
MLARLISSKDDRILYECYEKMESDFIREKLDFNLKAMERSIDKVNENVIKNSRPMKLNKKMA